MRTIVQSHLLSSCHTRCIDGPSVFSAVVSTDLAENHVTGFLEHVFQTPCFVRMPVLGNLLQLLTGLSAFVGDTPFFYDFLIFDFGCAICCWLYSWVCFGFLASSVLIQKLLCRHEGPTLPVTLPMTSSGGAPVRLASLSVTSCH